MSEGFLSAPPSGELTPTTPAPHQQALVSLETGISQQVHQPIADLLLGEAHANSLVALAGAGLPPLAAGERPHCDVEASQMEMSPAPTTGERAGGGGGAMDGVREGRLILITLSTFCTPTEPPVRGTKPCCRTKLFCLLLSPCSLEKNRKNNLVTCHAKRLCQMVSAWFLVT